jgi:serine/threonine protein phosphatase PrpC
MKKKKLQPLKQERIKFSFKTKAGSNGNQTKINQDAAVMDVKMAHGLKMFCVCDGHGLNGHLVSAFIRVQLVSKAIIKTCKRKPQQADEAEARSTRKYRPYHY